MTRHEKMEKALEISITGRHLEITDALRDHVNDKAKRLARHFDRISAGDVTLTRDGSTCEVEVRVPAVRGQRIVALARDEEMYAAIDKAMDKADRQLRRLKEKLADHRVTPQTETASGESEDSEEEDDD